jgi:hypothetical protein
MKSNTPRSMPPAPPGSHREAVSPSLPGRADQLAIVFDRETQTRQDEQQLASAFRAAVNAFGGADALRAALGERETYITKITEAMGSSADRPIQARWFFPLLDDPRSAVILLGFLNERAGAEPPVYHREVSSEEIARAAAEVIAESGQMRDVFRQQIAKRLGVRIEAVKL